jgi:vacuolar-type H+-ATPase subunit C/Vma6
LSSQKLERVFKESLIDADIKIVKNSPKKVSPYLEMYLKHFELENVKSLVKAVYAGLSLEDKIAKIYLQAEYYLKNRVIFEKAIKAADLKELRNIFKKTEYSLVLGLGLKKYEETGSIISFDILLDRGYYERLCEVYYELPNKEKNCALYYVSSEIDSFVILMLLRGKILNYNTEWLRAAAPKCVFNLSLESLDSIVAAADFESALNIVLKTPYSRFFAKSQTPEETIANAQKSFAKALIVHAKESRVIETFNVGAPLSFLTQKKGEVHNLTALSVAIEAGMNPELIRNFLLLPS